LAPDAAGGLAVGGICAKRLVGFVVHRTICSRQLDISVPEAGNALAGLLVMAAAGFEWYRRKRTAGG